MKKRDFIAEIVDALYPEDQSGQLLGTVGVSTHNPTQIRDLCNAIAHIRYNNFDGLLAGTFILMVAKKAVQIDFGRAYSPLLILRFTGKKDARTMVDKIMTDHANLDFDEIDLIENGESIRLWWD